MKLLVRLLAGLGVLFVAIVVGIAALLWAQSDFADEHESFVRSFMADYSETWKIADVRERVSNELLLQIQSPEGAKVVAIFERLGRLESIEDLQIERYHTTLSERTGTFTFKAEFEGAPTVVTLQLRVSDDGPRVNGLHIEPLADLARPGGGAADI